MPKITKSNLAVHNDNDKITISLSVLFGNVIEAANTHWSEKQNLVIFVGKILLTPKSLI